MQKGASVQSTEVPSVTYSVGAGSTRTGAVHVDPLKVRTDPPESEAAQNVGSGHEMLSNTPPGSMDRGVDQPPVPFRYDR